MNVFRNENCQFEDYNKSDRGQSLNDFHQCSHKFVEGNGTHKKLQEATFFLINMNL